MISGTKILSSRISRAKAGREIKIYVKEMVARITTRFKCLRIVSSVGISCKECLYQMLLAIALLPVSYCYLVQDFSTRITACSSL
jgi:hypothetical protein